MPLFTLTTDQPSDVLIQADSLDAAEKLADQFCIQTEQPFYALVQIPDAKACALIASANLEDTASEHVLFLTQNGMARLRRRP